MVHVDMLGASCFGNAEGVGRVGAVELIRVAADRPEDDYSACKVRPVQVKKLGHRPKEV